MVDCQTIFNKVYTQFTSDVRARFSNEQVDALRNFIKENMLDDTNAVGEFTEDDKTDLLLVLGYPVHVQNASNYEGDVIKDVLWKKFHDKLVRMIRGIPTRTWKQWEEEAAETTSDAGSSQEQRAVSNSNESVPAPDPSKKMAHAIFTTQRQVPTLLIAGTEETDISQ